MRSNLGKEGRKLLRKMMSSQFSEFWFPSLKKSFNCTGAGQSVTTQRDPPSPSLAGVGERWRRDDQPEPRSAVGAAYL
jgi:hypothetical protein